MTDSAGTNAQQIAYWNEVSGPKWVSLSERINDQIEPLGIAAMERARVAAGASNVEFTRADAQVDAFEPDAFTLIFSRFGVMFFEDPAAAFSNLRGASWVRLLAG